MKSLVESLSEDLLSELLKAGRVNRRPNMNPWYIAMGKILKRPNGQQVVEWVIQHLRDTHCPRVFSPVSLNAKFTRLEKCWKKDGHGGLHARTNAVFEALRHLNWPVSEPELRRSVNRSLLNIKDVRLRLKQKRFKSDAAEFFADQITPADTACLAWYQELWKRLQNWPEFTGDLTPFEFDLANKTTQQFLYRTLNRFPNDQVESLYEDQTA